MHCLFKEANGKSVFLKKNIQNTISPENFELESIGTNNCLVFCLNFRFVLKFKWKKSFLLIIACFKIYDNRFTILYSVEIEFLFNLIKIFFWKCENIGISFWRVKVWNFYWRIMGKCVESKNFFRRILIFK